MAPALALRLTRFKPCGMPTVLDLTRLPRRLGFFEQQSDSGDRDRHAIQFLHRFVKSLAMKVERGEREHINCVPTQVVTEWFRRVCNEIRMATGATLRRKYLIYLI